jgi:hypothetical protein
MATAAAATPGQRSLTSQPGPSSQWGRRMAAKRSPPLLMMSAAAAGSSRGSMSLVCALLTFRC